MLAIGLLSLFSIGMVGFLTSGDGDDAETQDAIPQDTQEKSVSPTEFLGIPKDVPPETDGKDQQASDDTLDPDAPDTIEKSDDAQGIVETGAPEKPDDLDVADADPLPDTDTDSEKQDAAVSTPVTDETTLAGTEDDVARPPVGEDYNDPRLNAEEADAIRLAEERAAEEARLPENLVTVTGAFDSEVSDELVLSGQLENTERTDADFIVTAPDGPNDIDVGYDDRHTFQIDYSAQTSTITASLNSHFQGPEGDDVPVVTQETDENGIEFTQTTLTKSFEGSTEITINVPQAHVGEHIAQIDLRNPDDSVHFEFADDVTGNYHLVYNEVDQNDSGDTNSVRSLFVIETLSFVDELTDEHVVIAMEEGVGAAGVGIIIAEIFLGEDALDVSGDPDTGDGYAMEVSNFINQNPQVTSNFEWTSISEREDLAPEEPLTAEQLGPRAPDFAASGGNTVSADTGGNNDDSISGNFGIATPFAGLINSFGNFTSNSP